MNIFSPYKVLQYTTGSVIELELPSWRKKVNFFLFRIMPFVLIFLMLNVYKTSYKEMPTTLLFSLFICVATLCVIMLVKKYVVKLSITKTGIEIYKNGVGGEMVQFISINEIEKVQYKVRRGKNGGTFFYVKPINKRKIEFLAIPVFNMRAESTRLIKEELKKITSVNVDAI